MKRIFIYLFLLLGSLSTLTAQDTFQGTVTYTYEVKGENAEMMQAMMPQKMVVKYGKKHMMTYMEGGMMAGMMGKIVVDTESGESFVIKDDEKAVYMMKKEDLEQAEQPKVNNSIEEGETKDILGYTCKKYKLSATQNGQEVTQYIWATEELKAPDLRTPGMQQMSNMGLAEHVKGFPMEIEIAMPGMKTTMIMRVSELDDTKISASEFKRPEGYETKDFSEFMKGKF